MDVNLGNTKGVMRTLDAQNRITLPKDFLKRLNINENIEIFMVKNGMFLRKGEND